MYPTVDEFVKLLNTRTVDWIIDNYLFHGLPFYSSHRPELHGQLLRAISKGLRIPQQDICVIGSARLGFSISPLKFGTPFNRFSDIDICIVSVSLFDPSWLDILKKGRKGPVALTPRTESNLRRHREYHYVHNGWMYPGSILQVLNIGQVWLRTFNGLSRISELATRSIGGRLYRSWDHARLYHRWSLGRLRAKLNGR